MRSDTLIYKTREYIEKRFVNWTYRLIDQNENKASNSPSFKRKWVTFSNTRCCWLLVDYALYNDGAEMEDVKMNLKRWKSDTLLERV